MKIIKSFHRITGNRQVDIGLLSIFLFVLTALSSVCADDWRAFESGNIIPDENYCDQPYIVKTKDGNWLCVLTTGKGVEGKSGQHVVATISNDMGKSWSPMMDIEPAGKAEASWGVPYITPNGRVYVFYNYNGDLIGHGKSEYAMADGETNFRGDMLGWYCYKFSDDGGRTWSKRYRLPLPVADVDRNNQWQGKVQIFWGIDKPVSTNGSLYFAFTRLGKYLHEQGEGWVYRSDNILTELNPHKINWDLLPSNGKGLRNEKFGSVQEEFNLIPLKGDDLYMVCRTEMGYPLHTYSRDGGLSWEPLKPMTYTPNGRKIRNPRACPKLWKLKNGRYLFWFHNNGMKSFNVGENYGSRNVAWVTAGRLVDGKMHWSEPEIIRYVRRNPLYGCSYPDLVEDDGKYFISSTEKHEARIGQIPNKFMNLLLKQHEISKVAQDGLIIEVDNIPAKSCENLKYSKPLPGLPCLADGGAFTIEVWVKLKRVNKTQILIDTIDDKGNGVAIRCTLKGAPRIDFSDGISGTSWEGDPGVLKVDRLQQVVFVVDGRSKIVSVYVDGKINDGGENDSRPYGWGRFLMNRFLDRKMTEKVLMAHEIQDVSGANKVSINCEAVKKLRIYNRQLLTSEVVGNYRSGIKKSAYK